MLKENSLQLLSSLVCVLVSLEKCYEQISTVSIDKVKYFKDKLQFKQQLITNMMNSLYRRVLTHACINGFTYGTQ